MNIFVGNEAPASKAGVWLKDGVEPFIWDADVNRWVPIMRERYRFGFMLEQVFDETGSGQVYVKGRWVPVTSYWRCYSARLHGPLMFSRTGAFFGWLKNWITDFVRTSCRRMRG